MGGEEDMEERFHRPAVAGVGVVKQTGSEGLQRVRRGIPAERGRAISKSEREI